MFKTLWLTIIGLMALVPPLRASDAIKPLHSNAKSTNKLYLDFDGHTGPAFGVGPVVTTPPFDVPEAIPEIHAGVAAFFAPFDLDVTTEEPSGGRVAIVRIGGKWSDWLPERHGGTSLPGGLDAGRNVAYVFAVDSLQNNTRHVLRSITHEAGHVFGLQHQAKWVNGVMVAEYNPGGGTFAPIMGSNLEAERVGWIVGKNQWGAAQDDVAILTATLGLVAPPPPPPPPPLPPTPPPVVIPTIPPVVVLPAPGS